jgi:hypothetical protein
MSPEDCKRSREQRPPSLQHIQDQIRSACEDLIHCCSQEIDMTFYQTEQSLQGKISSLACLVFQLFLMSFQERFDYAIGFPGEMEKFWALALSPW